MKWIIFGLLLMSAFLTNAQFQPSSLPESFMPGSSGDAHIHDVTCYSISNANFDNEICDLYISTWWGSNVGMYWQRSTKDLNGITSILDEGILNILL